MIRPALPHRMRGPGETQLETDRRLLGKRVKLLKERLSRHSRQRGVQRKARMRGAGRKLPIEIKVENPVVLFTPEGMADVRFDQHYRSGPVVESNRKYFLMSSQGGRWFIEAEKMLTDPLVGGPGVATQA